MLNTEQPKTLSLQPHRAPDSPSSEGPAGLMVVVRSADGLMERHFFSARRLGVLISLLFALNVVVFAGALALAWGVGSSAALQSGAAETHELPAGRAPGEAGGPDAAVAELFENVKQQSDVPLASKVERGAAGQVLPETAVIRERAAEPDLPGTPAAALPLQPQTEVKVLVADQNRGVLKIALTNLQTDRETFGTLRVVAPGEPTAGYLLDPKKIKEETLSRLRTTFALTRSDTVFVPVSAPRTSKVVVLILHDASGVYQAPVQLNAGKPRAGRPGERSGFPPVTLTPVSEVAVVSPDDTQTKVLDGIFQPPARGTH